MEVHRPTWEGGKVDFAGRSGFPRLAIEEDARSSPS